MPARPGRPPDVFSNRGVSRLEQQQQLDRFLAGVEARALRMAEIATGQRADALDIVQDAMIGLATKYARRPAAEWGPLFMTILQSRIRDWYRRTAVRRRLFPWLSTERGEMLDNTVSAEGQEPAQILDARRGVAQLDAAIGRLPIRQQQAVLLRLLEGYDVSQTARVMGCSAGSVKTHYSRAIQRLRSELGDVANDD